MKKEISIIVLLAVVLMSLLTFAPKRNDIKAVDTSGERFEILSYQKVGFLQVRVVCDKETDVVYTWSYAVDNGGTIGGISIEPLLSSGGSTLWHIGCGK